VAVAAICDWLQMFASTQSYVSNEKNPDGTNYTATATIAISDIAKVEGHTMTAMDIADGAASSIQAYIVAAFKLHDNARRGATVPYSPHLRDINATVELRQIAATVSPSESLTAADQANGVTYRGSVALTFNSHYAFEGFTPSRTKATVSRIWSYFKTGKPSYVTRLDIPPWLVVLGRLFDTLPTCSRESRNALASSAIQGSAFLPDGSVGAT
jgi:hypothetical protein